MNKNNTWYGTSPSAAGLPFTTRKTTSSPSSKPSSFVKQKTLESHRINIRIINIRIIDIRIILFQTFQVKLESNKNRHMVMFCLRWSKFQRSRLIRWKSVIYYLLQYKWIRTKIIWNTTYVRSTWDRVRNCSIYIQFWFTITHHIFTSSMTAPKNI